MFFQQAEALHLLRNHLKPGATVLELGSGTGYLATCMAELLQGNGSVIGLDLVAPLVDFSHKTSVEVAPHLIEQNVLKFFGEFWVFPSNLGVFPLMICVRR